MSEASQFTAQQASDPATPPEVLAAIAEHRPDLRPYVAANPTAYPGLIEWLGNLGDPAVDAALQARSGAPLTPEPPTAPVTPEPPTTPLTPAPEGFAAPGYQPPAAAAGAAATAAYGAAQAPGYPAPETPAYGAPQQTAPYAAPQASGAYPPPGGDYAPPPGGPYGGPPGAPYGAAMGGPPKKRSLTWLWILLGILGALIVGGVLLFIFVFNRVSSIVEDLPTVIGSINSDAQTYGDDPALDALWDACEGGDMQACDDLYFESPVGSEYESFGDTCGNRTEGGTMCADEASLAGQHSDGVNGINLEDFSVIDSNAWESIAKDPDGSAGQQIVVFAEVTQFDGATGRERFRADVGVDQPASEFELETNSVIEGRADLLSQINQGDVVKLYAEVAGSLSYGTQIGGSTVVPALIALGVENVGYRDLTTDAVLGSPVWGEYGGVEIPVTVTNSSTEVMRYSVDVVAESADGSVQLGSTGAYVQNLEPGQVSQTSANFFEDLPRDAVFRVAEVDRYNY